MTSVRDWLEGLDLGQYVNAFEGDDNDMSLPAQEDDQLMNETGVKSTDHLLRLINAIARLKLVQVITNTLSYAASRKLRTVNSTYLVSGQMHP